MRFCLNIVRLQIKRILRGVNLLLQDLHDLYLNVRYNHKRIDYSSLARGGKRALVLGNGPSLSDLLNENSKFDDTDLYVCNEFALSVYYETLKPTNYVIVDPVFFKECDEYVRVKETWHALINRTTWNITLFTAAIEPSHLNFIENILPDNFNWVNILPIHFSGRNRYKILSRGLGLVGGLTVTHVSLQVALLKRYEEVYLTGVDLNWIESIKYDYTNHKLYLLKNHFYGEERVYFGESILAGSDLIEELKTSAKILSDFKELYRMSQFLHIKLFRSTKSFAYFIPFKTFVNHSSS